MSSGRQSVNGGRPRIGLEQIGEYFAEFGIPVPLNIFEGAEAIVCDHRRIGAMFAK